MFGGRSVPPQSESSRVARTISVTTKPASRITASTFQYSTTNQANAPTNAVIHSFRLSRMVPDRRRDRMVTCPGTIWNFRVSAPASLSLPRKLGRLSLVSAARPAPWPRYHVSQCHCNGASRQSPHGELRRVVPRVHRLHCLLSDLHPPTAAPRVFAPQVRTPERRRVRDVVASASQASPRFSDARVILEDFLRLDSGDSVPSMPSRHGRTALFTDDFWNVRHICTAACSNARVSVAAACRSAGHWFDGDGRGGDIRHQHRLAPCAAPRHGRGDGLDAPAVSIAVTTFRTGIDPNVAASADLARRIPVAVCIRFAVCSGHRRR